MGEDGYPTDEELRRIRSWRVDGLEDMRNLLAFLRACWWSPDWGWREEEATDDTGGHFRRYNVSTGGWSGNEDAIDALRENGLAWLLAWHSSRRGGHYEFRIPSHW